MSTFMIKLADIDRKWYILDAAGKPLGRVAVVVASILRGKHRPYYTPHLDCGDHVIVINAALAVLTGKKLLQKEYIRHSGYVGGLKRVLYKDLMAKRPQKAMELAVWGMLPHNSLGRKIYKKLRVYSGSDHKNSAQQPELWTGDII